MSDIESLLYDKFVDVLNDKLDGNPTAQDLTVVLNFIKYNNIQASDKHTGVKKLSDKVATNLPFDDEEYDNVLPLKKVK